MKKIISKLFLIFMFIMAIGIIRAQNSGWIKEEGTGFQSSDIQKLSFLFGNNVLYAISDSGTVKVSYNNGNTWNTISTTTYHLNEIDANKNQTSRNNLLHNPATTGRDSLWTSGNGGVILFTSNSGTNWIQQASNITGDIHALNFIDGQNGWAADWNGNVTKTTNAGNTWIQQGGVGFQVHSIYFTDLNNGWICGGSISVKYTSNGGVSWVNRNPPGLGFCILSSIRFINLNIGWVGGTNNNNYALFRTTNGGINWDTCSTGNPVQYNITSLSFINALTGYASSIGVSPVFSAIFKTTNGGNNWTSQTLPPNTPHLNDIQFSGPDTGFAVGSNGTVLYTSSGGNPIGIIPISHNVPVDFALEQNYPNPFNPTTNINIAVSKSGFIKLVVYDVLGREVETLVNQQLNAGIYKVDWNASNYPSGVYFYKMTSGDLALTKKMILVK